MKGGDVDRYYIQWNGKNWISYGDWLAHPRTKEYFTNQRILVREITNPRILATITSDEYYNSPSIINSINFQKISPEILLGIINSKLLSYYHIKFSPKAQKGIFPKILVNDVRNIPIKKPNETSGSVIEEQVKKIFEIKKTDRLANVSNFEKILDDEVYKLYKINKDEIKEIEEYLASFN